MGSSSEDKSIYNDNDSYDSDGNPPDLMESNINDSDSDSDVKPVTGEIDKDMDYGRISEAIDDESPRRADCSVDDQEKESQEEKEPEPKGEHQPERESWAEGVRSSRRTSRPPTQHNPSTGELYIQALRRKEKVHNLKINDMLGSRTAE